MKFKKMMGSLMDKNAALERERATDEQKKLFKATFPLTVN